MCILCIAIEHITRGMGLLYDHN